MKFWDRIYAKSALNWITHYFFDIPDLMQWVNITKRALCLTWVTNSIIWLNLSPTFLSVCLTLIQVVGLFPSECTPLQKCIRPVCLPCPYTQTLPSTKTSQEKGMGGRIDCTLPPPVAMFLRVGDMFCHRINLKYPRRKTSHRRASWWAWGNHNAVWQELQKIEHVLVIAEPCITTSRGHQRNTQGWNIVRWVGNAVF